MKLSEYIPQVRMIDKNARKLDHIADFIEKSAGGTGASSTNYTPTFGVDQYTNAWITSRVGYRRQLLLDLWSLYLTTSEVRGPITIIRNEVFRRGYSWYPKFAGRCPKCGKEYQELPKDNMCDIDGTPLVGPDESQRKLFEEFAKKVNIFEQSFDQVMGGYEDSLNWADDGFLYLAKEYIADESDPNKIHSKINEIRVVNPAMMEMDLDDRGRPNNAHYVCYMHRDQFEKEPGLCKECRKEFGVDRELVPARWVYFHQGTEPKYLLGSEVLHQTKFTHSETTGVSPLLTLYDEILSLVGMRKTTYRYFFERKLPAGMLLVATDDPDGLRRERANIENRMRTDPDYMPMIAYSNKGGTRGRVDFIKLFHNLLETDYLPIRTYITERIAAVWGVSPIWTNMQDSSGGISTQSQQLVVTGRVVTSDQDRFNKLIFPWLFDQLGITDWSIKLLPPEEKAEETQLRFMAQKVTAIQQLREMGFKVELVRKANLSEIEFEVSGAALDVREQQAAAQEAQAQQQNQTPGANGSEVADVAAKGAGSEPNRGAQKGDLHAHGNFPPHSKKTDHNKAGDRKVKQETGGEKEESDED